MTDFSQLQILHEDEHLIVVNKPAGLRVIPDGYRKDLPDLHHLLGETYGRLWVVHRLDRETSGAILFARTAESHKLLNQQFQNREVNKVYHLLAIGHPLHDELKIEYPLRINGDRAHRTVVDFENGKPAYTYVRLIQRFPNNINLVEALPKTGYTHQIRAHLAAAGYWLLNDTLYFPYDQPPEQPNAHPALPAEYRTLCQKLPIHRIALHCLHIQFFHPYHKQLFSITAPYPADFLQTLELLQKEGGD